LYYLLTLVARVPATSEWLFSLGHRILSAKHGRKTSNTTHFIISPELQTPRLGATPCGVHQTDATVSTRAWPAGGATLVVISCDSIAVGAAWRVRCVWKFLPKKPTICANENADVVDTWSERRASVRGVPRPRHRKRVSRARSGFDARVRRAGGEQDAKPRLHGVVRGDPAWGGFPR
jgi:hypothetical protein